MIVNLFKMQDSQISIFQISTLLEILQCYC